MRLLRVFAEGVRFLWSIRDRRRWLPVPPTDYLLWRLGTVYRTFDEAGAPKPLRVLLADLWRDRHRAASFLLWRREMRLRINDVR